MAAALGALGEVFLGAAGGVRQDVTTPELTAAFLFNFVKFTTWPADALRDGDSIVVCVNGDPAVAESLGQLTRSQKVDGHGLMVRRTNLEPLIGCHLVYGATLDKARAQQFIKTAAGLPILTVSDFPDFAQFGGVAHLFIDSGRMRFAVNPGAADRARLRISSKLLSLAKVVRDDGGA
jgi:hypothetical protein